MSMTVVDGTSLRRDFFHLADGKAALSDNNRTGHPKAVIHLQEFAVDENSIRIDMTAIATACGFSRLANSCLVSRVFCLSTEQEFVMFYFSNSQ